MNVFSSEKWEGKMLVSFTHFAGDEIVGSSDVKLSIKDAKKLIDELVGAVNDIEAREGK
jgi:hypothetical protein